jgi:hypothetical protein
MDSLRFLCPNCRGKLSIDIRATACAVDCPRCLERINPWGEELLDYAFGCPACTKVLVVRRDQGGTVIECCGCGEPVQCPASPLEQGKLCSAGPGGRGAHAANWTPVKLSDEEVEFLTQVESVT